MQSGGYLPSLATVSSHLCTVDKMCMHGNLNVLNRSGTTVIDNSLSAAVYIKGSYQGISVPKYA